MYRGVEGTFKGYTIIMFEGSYKLYIYIDIYIYLSLYIYTHTCMEVSRN